VGGRVWWWLCLVLVAVGDWWWLRLLGTVLVAVLGGGVVGDCVWWGPWLVVAVFGWAMLVGTVSGCDVFDGGCV